MAVIFPDAELVITGYLRSGLVARGETATVSTVYQDVPRSVWVRRDGGARIDQVRETVRLAVNVYADGATGQAVTDLTSLVRALLGDAADGAPVVAVLEVSGPVPIADTRPRRLLTYELTVRGEDLI